jgi:hypothetical protein
MSDVERLLAEFKQAHRSGAGSDPRPFLERVSGTEREQLAGLIDAYLARAPRRGFDEAAFRDSPAMAVAESVQRSLAGAGGLWPAVLPRLRTQARIKRADLVAELAARLGAESQQAKVASYYHQMEQGLLPAAGVSDTVLEALGSIVGSTRAALRRAGELPAPGGPVVESGAVFARRTYRREADAILAADQPGPEADPGWDEVDRLFRGG